MTNPVQVIPRCGKGTFNGGAADASKYGFAPCIREQDHPNVGTGCDSGPATTSSEAA